MNSDEIKRATELWLCKNLTYLTGGETPVPIVFYASKGGADVAADGGPIVPPFGFVQVTEATRVQPDDSTWLCVAKVCYLTHIADATSPAHSHNVRVIEEALRQLPSGNNAGRDEALGVIVSGSDLGDSDDFTDDEDHTHGDVFTLSVGIGQLNMPA